MDADDLRATRRSYDDVAADYARLLGDELLGKPFDRALLAALGELAEGGPVADIGCGPGHVTAYLAGLGRRAFGLDLSPRMCAVGASTTGLPFAAADMARLPLRSGVLAGIVCLYAVIHLDDDARAGAYREFARVLQPGAPLLLSFHTSDPDIVTGGANVATTMMGHEVDLTFRFLDPEAELGRLGDAGLDFIGRLDRAPHPGAEHPSNRTYLIMRAT